MSRDSDAKKERQRERKHAQQRVRTLRNLTIGAAVSGAIAAVLILGVVAGSGGDNSGDGPSPAGSAAVADFRIKTPSWSGGEEFVLSQQRGKPVAVYAVASWCFTCIPEAQAWGKIQRELGDKISVLIVSVDPGESENSFKQFKEISDGPDRYWAIDSDGSLVQALDIFTLDTTVLLDADGREVYRDGVPTSEGKLREKLASLIDTPVPTRSREGS